MREESHPLQFGNLRLASRYLLSPLAGYTNLPFRRVVREQGGVGLATTDLVNARALLRTSPRTMELIATCPEDRPLAVQLYGADSKEMSEAARFLEDYGAAVVDINMGCPVHKVTRGGGGSALLCPASASTTIALVRAVVDAVNIPVTVKMRLGWDDHDQSAPFFAREFEKAGAAAIIIHGRTRAQGFSGLVSLDGIRTVVEAVDAIPVIGNGDVRSVADAQRMFESTGCAGISIGRGALLNPWIFAQLCWWERSGEPGPMPGYNARLELMHRHYHLLVEQIGERFASLNFRKVANWYCRVLKPGRATQQRLMLVSGIAEFEAILDCMREPPACWDRGSMPEIAVPAGPIEHW